MLIWTGKGILSFVVAIIAALLWILIFPKEYEDYGFPFGLFVAGLFSWHYGFKWNRIEPVILVDEKSGQRYVMKSNHTFMWIKMQYWGVIHAIVGFAILTQHSLKIAISSLLVASVIAYFLYPKRNKISKEMTAAENNYEPIIQQGSEPIKQQGFEQAPDKNDWSRFMPK
jgi:hypothetical protein